MAAIVAAPVDTPAASGIHASGAERLLLVHRPVELPVESEHERAEDGYETTV